MTESLKAARFVHNLLVVVCAGIIVFSLAPDRARRYSSAEHELADYLQLSQNEFTFYLSSLLKQDERNEKLQVIELLRKNGYHVPDSVSFNGSLWTAPMNIGGSVATFCMLADHEETVIVPSVVQDYAGPLQPSFISGSDPIFKTDSANYVTTIKLNAQPDTDLTSDIWIINAKPTEFPKPAFLTLVIRKSDGKQMLRSLRVAYVAGTQETGYFEKDWLKSLPHASRLIKGDRCMPNSLGTYPVIARMDPGEAMRYLESRREAEKKRDLQVSSLQIDSATVGQVVPAIVGLLLLFFISHLRHLYRILGEGHCSKNFPWVGLFPDWLGKVISYATILVLPVLSEILVTRRAEPAFLLVKLGLPLLVAVLSLWAASELWRLRKAVKPSSGDSSDPLCSITS